MLLGKRHRPAAAAATLRRTTSMSGGVSNLEPHHELMMTTVMPPDHDHNTIQTTLHQQGEGVADDRDLDDIKDPPHHRHDAIIPMGGHDHGLRMTVPDQAKDVFGPNFLGVSPNSHLTTNNPPTNLPTSPTTRVIQTPHFLRTCGLCKCPLAPGRDIYMYRGDTAFCSLECREERMKDDSRKEKSKLKHASNNRVDHRTSAPPPAATATATAKASTQSKAAACT